MDHHMWWSKYKIKRKGKEMTLEEKCLLAIEKGYTYNPETGDVIGVRGKVIRKKDDKGYIQICLSLNKKTFYFRAHQFAWYYIHKECVDCIDHKDGDKSNNKIDNLRSVTQQENQWNHTKAKGYIWYKPLNKWRATIAIKGKTIYLGYFNNEEDARKAYLDAKKIYHKINEK